MKLLKKAGQEKFLTNTKNKVESFCVKVTIKDYEIRLV